MSNEVTGKAKGGLARAASMSPEKRRAQAKKAAEARWGLKATHKGNFRKDFGIDVDCYVLDDEKKTAVVSLSGLNRALGLSTGGGTLQRLLSGRAFANTGAPELLVELGKPIKFQWGSGGAEQPPSTIHGFDVTLLIDICKEIAKAEANGTLTDRQQNIARQAHVITNACAKYGIQDLVYKLAGYNSTREEAVAAFKFYVQSEARDYEREFPNQLYKEWYRLYGLQEPERGKAWKFKHLTVNHVWFPLARSHGRILELTRAQKAASKERHKKLHQFLSIIGVKALRTHLGRLLGIAEVSETQAHYERHVNRIFGDQIEMDV